MRKKSERGSITIITLTSILFMIAFLSSSYMILANKEQAQAQIIRETKEIYEADIVNISTIYDSLLEEVQKVCNHEWGTPEVDSTTGETFVTCEKCGKVEEYDDKKDKNGVTIASGTDTTPYLPDDNSEITNNDLATGLTVKDSHQNEWVWIEVPTSIYANTAYNTESTTGDMQPANSEDYEKIRYCLETYAKTLIPEGTSYKNTKNGYKDYWYYMPSSGTEYSKDPLTGDQYKNDAANSDNISTYLTDTDVTKGIGLTYEQYQTKYKAMLKSVYENGGFYIGKYETGTETARGASNNELTTAVIKENAYPYNYVTISQAEAKSEELATGRKNCKFNVWSTMGFSIKAFK